MSQKLLFILYYWKVSPCYDVLGFQFDMDGSKACTNVHALWPVLKRALANQEVLPKREFATIEELRAAFADITDLFIDATERPHARPHDDDEQRETYRGKKKRHTVKNTIIATVCQYIVFFGLTVAGSVHDYTRFKEEFPLPEEGDNEALAAWFEDFVLWLELGYRAFRSAMPRKTSKNLIKNLENPKPIRLRHSPQNRNGKSRDQPSPCHRGTGYWGAETRWNSCPTICNHTKDFVDEVGIIGAGLWNWKLKCKGTSYQATTLLL